MAISPREVAMDNKLNEIRGKIRALRAAMLDLEDKIRAQVNRDEECSEISLRLMEMRREMLDLIRQRNAMGGDERMLSVGERLKAEYVQKSRKPLKGVQARR
jgi:hypothetical protein